MALVGERAVSIIDCHCHAGAGDGLTGPWDTRASLREFERWSVDAGIERTVLFAAFHTDYAVANREVAAIVKKGAGRYLGFAFVHAVRDAGRVAALVREAVEVHGFCGIKVHRHDAPISREICEAARHWRLPVLYDVMGHAQQIELLATEYPDVAFIIPHLGSFSDDWRAQLSVIDHISRHANVHTDTSGVRRFDLLQQAMRRAGPRKILFGSDGPWLHPGVELEKIHALHLSPADESLVCGGNLLRLISRKRAPERIIATHYARTAPVSDDPWIAPAMRIP